jgi:hypothetical protein
MEHMTAITAQVLLILLAPSLEFSHPPAELRISPVPIRGITCKQVGSCEEAVQIWCNGYSGADRDDDGIPCENVCHSLEQVNQIRQSLGC